jgi:hypothetical protein
MSMRPGSEEARERGCICPTLDPTRGDERVVVRDECPMHGTQDDGGES